MERGAGSCGERGVERKPLRVFCEQRETDDRVVVSFFRVISPSFWTNIIFVLESQLPTLVLVRGLVADVNLILTGFVFWLVDCD